MEIGKSLIGVNKIMKIIIVTVFNSQNFGSFWQAKALSEFLEKKGHDVVFLHSRARSTFKGLLFPYIKASLKSACTFNYRRSIFMLKSLVCIIKNIYSVKICFKTKKILNCDAAIFGSDEIWNVTRPEMKNYKIFWGEELDIAKKIAYAPSINSATASDLIAYGAGKLTNNFAALSVRDLWSKSQLKHLTDREISWVVDPTLLFDYRYYNKFPTKDINFNYIAIYYFGENRKTVEYINSIAFKLDCKTISIAQYIEGFDDNVTGLNPFSYYNNASYVITNTFHGTVFAINYMKPFICLAEGNKKITELLAQFDLEDRIVDGESIDEAFCLLSEKSINWDHVGSILQEARDRSSTFLDKALSE